ncbi:hypothetical protein [Acinetobacter sp. YH16038]|uniref:hypothetical protein n=1 Tax=Acinetobacter sp. YH16038 TaxID=2601183 RepID=UPI0015D33445|nr:hypothetical protein [Acinetobacter sp. YH16038]
MKKLHLKKIHHDDVLDKKMNIIDVSKKFKVSVITAAITTLICTSTSNYAADLEIYKIPENSTGTATLMLMLDTSGSMAWTMGGSGSTSDSNPSRMSILKQGLRDVLQGTQTTPRVADKIVMGLATFAGDNGYIRIPAKPLGEVTGTRSEDVEKVYAYRYGTSGNRKYGACIEWNLDLTCKKWADETTQDIVSGKGYSSNNRSCPTRENESCRIYYKTEQVEVKKTHRDDLITEINGLRANGGTPTPYAYAEAAAYLMGTSTKSNITTNVQMYFVDPNDNYYLSCQEWNSQNLCTSWSSRWTAGYNYSNGYLQNGSGTEGNYAGHYYWGPKPSRGAYSGFDSSVEASKDGNVYKLPDSIEAQLGNTEAAANKRECSGQGIYFLTDGEPEPGGTAPGSDGKSGTAYELMTASLGDKGTLFSCANSQLGKRTPYKDSRNAWSCIGNYAQTLIDTSKNPLGLKIKTAVVGFGSGFSSEGSNDVKDAKDWGTIGGGKWYVGTNSQSVVDSINKFIDEIQKDIPSMSTGSSTIPMDALNPEIIQPYAYSPQFEPKADPADNRQLWFGNLKKYYVVNGGIYSNDSGGNAYTVVKKSKLQDLADIWAKENINYPENTPIFKKGGILSQLILGLVNGVNSKNEPVKKAGRKLLTEYDFDGTADEGEQVSRDFNLKQISYDYTTNEKTKTDDSDRIRSLMALLGINISDSTETNGTDLSGASAEENLRQMGSIYHSLPVLLTQEGKAVAEKNTTTNKVHISTTSRKDYIMFGTTQGLLTVVDADTGNEKFSFVPKEMIEKQSETFKENAGNLSGGKNALYYGIDGEWTAHTVYVTDNDGTLTVKGASRAILGKTPAENENFDGKQWVYGGMRMGGRSYYSLDLTDIDNPKLKFHIDPSSGKVYSKDNPAGKSFSAIENMAQSWSKPKLDYVNWKGERKLVMFVGGGYDAGGENGDGLYAHGIRTGYAGYEHYNYVQDNKKGSGVYMFDADNGDLLWYANSDDGQADVEHVSHSDLKYSIASDIKTIDRNNDGIVDHLYFGDLAGQGFRVDFNGTKDNFNSQVNKILDLHIEDNLSTAGTSPRFYMAPVFTAHHSAHKKEGAHVVIATFVSGNKSSPLLGTVDSPTTTGKTDPLGLQYDGVYAVYDYDIHPDGKFFPNTNLDARTLADVDDEASTTKLKLISTVVRNDTEDTLVKGATANSTTGWGGWYYRFDTKFDGSEADASIVKGLSPLIAMEGSLYVTMYDASNNGTSSSCGAGVKGHSFTQRLCLPTGVCPENANYKYNLGAGIIGLNVGSVDGSNIKSIVVPDPDDICVGENCSPCTGTDCKAGQKFISAGGSIRFIPNRWFERYAKME